MTNQKVSRETIDFLTYLTDPEKFITDVLGLTCKDFHKEWIDLFENNQYISLLAPRGHGKTTILGSYITWRIVKDPNIRILIVTINQDKADEMMSFIQHQLERNEKLTEVFGEQRGSSKEWSRSTIRVARAGRTGIAHKEPTLSVIGVTGSMVGGHYDMIILDDVTDQNNSKTEHRRRELVRWFNMTLMPMLEPEGKLLSIGTKWHEADIHKYLQGLSGYTTKIYKAIIEEPSEDDEGKILWPDRFSFEKLSKIREQYGSIAFQMQYQNEFVSDVDSPIKYDWIQNAQEKYKPLEHPYEAYIGVDLASKGEDTDYFSITVIGVKDGIIYVVDGIKTKASLFKQFELIRSFDSKWQPIKIGIEQAAQQKMIVDQLVESTTLPIIPIKSSIVNDRMSRVQRLSVLFETGRVLLKTDMIDWVEQLTNFPRGANDDCIDSLCFAIQAAQGDIEDETFDWSDIPNTISAKKAETHVKSVRQPFVIKV